MFWYVIIMLLLGFPAFVAVYTHKRNIAPNNFVLLVGGLILFFFMAMRGEYVGADTKQYLYTFKQISGMSLKDAFTTPIYAYEGGTR